VRYLRALADGQISAEEAVKAYHGDLAKLNIKPYRTLKEDSELTSTATSYAGTGSTVSMSSPKPARSDGKPDFSKMSSAQKVAYARERLKSK